MIDQADGLLVEHPERPEWGPGRILAVAGTKVTVYWRDLPGSQAKYAVRIIDTRYVELRAAKSLSDPFLDNLPPYENGEFKTRVKKRVTFPEGLELFHRRFPLYFEDPAYLVDPKTNEREYKWKAHELFAATLGGGQAEDLLASGDLNEVRRRVLAVEGKVNVLSRFEKMGLRDGLRDDEAAGVFFRDLFALIAAGAPKQDRFEALVASLERLPVEEGKQRAATWTTATVFPYLALPDRFMFMKPEVSKDCALRLTFELNYRSRLNWLTYSRLMVMATDLLEKLRPYGARDFIDVQSFIWLVGSGLVDG